MRVGKVSNILIVDDEAGVREFVAEALEFDGFEPTAVASGDAALALVQQRAFDLMFTDLKIPGMGGLELLARAKELQPELEVVVLTAQGSVDKAVEAMKLGAFDFIQKPVSGPQELRLLASRALERRSLLDIKEGVARSGDGEPDLSYGDPQMEPVLTALRKVAKTTKDACDEAFAQSGYAASVSNFKNMSRATDMVFADGAELETPVMTGSAVEGFAATLSVTV